MESETTIKMTRPTTSPSNLFRRKACPASERMEAQFTEDDSTEQSDEGTLLHSLVDKERIDWPNELTGEQINALERACKLRDMATEAAFGFNKALHWAHEQKIAAFDGLEGTPDLVGHDGERGIVIDYKFGRNEVTEAAGNLQLAAYAVGLARKHSLREVTVAIVQPRAPKEKQLTIARYDSDGLVAALKEIYAILAACKAQYAPFSPSPDVCLYCRAKLDCAAYKETLKLTPLPDMSAAERLSDHELGRMLEVVSAACGDLGNKVKSEARQRATLGLPGWELKNTGFLREITDSKGAFAAFKAAFPKAEGLSDKFLAAAKFNIGDLQALFRELSGCKKTDEKEGLESLLGDMIARKEKLKTPVYVGDKK